MKYLRFILVILSFATLLAMIGCDSDSDSTTEPVSEWATIDSLDFQVFVGDYTGYCIIDEDGCYVNNDSRDWIIHDYDDNTYDGENDDDEIPPLIEFALIGYPSPSNERSCLLIDTPECVDLAIVIYNESLDFSKAMFYERIWTGSNAFSINFDEFDIQPDLYRIFIRMTNEDEGISKWSYGDILYDPEYEWYP